MRLLPALLLAGCAQVFGIENTTPPDADPAKVTVTMQRVSIGATLQKAPLDMSMQMGSFLVDDGAGGYTKVPAQFQAPDTLAAAIPGTPPALFTLPDTTPY